MAQTKYEELQDAISAYGAAAFQNLLRCKALAEAVLGGFHGWLGCPAACVSGVPPLGPFDPRKDYGDEAFSFNEREVITLEPLRFGVSLIVGNVEDSGSLFLRTMASIDVSGDAFDVFVGGQPVLRTPLQFDDHLGPIFAAIHKEFLETFETEVMEFNDARFAGGIGFLPP